MNKRSGTSKEAADKLVRGIKRKTRKHYSGEPVASVYTSWTIPEAEAYLTTGWGSGAITEFNLEYLYGPEPEVSGE